MSEPFAESLPRFPTLAVDLSSRQIGPGHLPVSPAFLFVQTSLKSWATQVPWGRQA